MLTYAIVTGNYKQAVSCIKFYNLPREACLVITGDYVFKKCRKEIRGLQIVLGDDAPKNSAFPYIEEELAQRLRPELCDGIISVSTNS